MTRAARARATPLTLALLRRHPLPPIGATGGKEERGAVLIVAGSVLVPGAAILAGLAALRAGCGKLAIAIDGRVAPLIAQAVPESLVLPLGGSAAFTRALREHLRSADAIVAGCGMRNGAATARLVARIARASDAPLVLDAGALAGVSAGPLARPQRCLLTPHAGEMAKLTGMTKRAIGADACAVAARVAAELDATVVLKGVQTFIADGRGVLRNDHGHPGLGTSGSGDVLAGALGALLARGAAPRWAAAWAVRLHALAGERLARRVGAAGFLAREIAHELPACMRACGQR